MLRIEATMIVDAVFLGNKKLPLGNYGRLGLVWGIRGAELRQGNNFIPSVA